MPNIKYLISKSLVYLLSPPSLLNCFVHKTSKVCPKSNLINTQIDKYSYIGKNCQLLDVRIGKFCSISDNCYIGGASHPAHWGATSPVFYKGRNILKKNFGKKVYIESKDLVTEIGNDVWIGAYSLIKRGIKIGDGAIIGMGSVVTKDVKTYEIVAGNPARLIKRRFDDDVVEKLCDCEWWEMDDDQLTLVAAYIDNIELFIDKVNQLKDKNL